MPAKIHLNESEIELASVSLSRLGTQLTDNPTPRPNSIDTHNLDTNTSVADFLSALRIAHYALIDATRSSSAELAKLLIEHAELDAFLSSQVSPSYLLPGQPN